MDNEDKRQKLFDTAKKQERHTVRDFMKKMKHTIAEGVEDAVIDAIVASMLAIGYA
jgi:predicted transcriptional regulator